MEKKGDLSDFKCGRIVLCQAGWWATSAEDHNWTIEDWKKVAWSDES